MDDERLIDALAKVHIEFILIHPFREGNGRLSRLLGEATEDIDGDTGVERVVGTKDDIDGPVHGIQAE